MSNKDPRAEFFKAKCPLCKLPARDMLFRVECMTINCKNYSAGAKKEYLDFLSKNLPAPTIKSEYSPVEPLPSIDLSWDDEEERTKPMAFTVTEIMDDPRWDDLTADWVDDIIKF